MHVCTWSAGIKQVARPACGSQAGEVWPDAPECSPGAAVPHIWKAVKKAIARLSLSNRTKSIQASVFLQQLHCIANLSSPSPSTTTVPGMYYVLTFLPPLCLSGPGLRARRHDPLELHHHPPRASIAPGLSPIEACDDLCTCRHSVNLRYLSTRASFTPRETMYFLEPAERGQRRCGLWI